MVLDNESEEPYQSHTIVHGTKPIYLKKKSKEQAASIGRADVLTAR